MKQRRGIRSPRKVVIRAGIFLLLGAIINVAVAWGFAAFWRLESNIGLTDHSVSQAGQFAHFECQAGLPYRSLQGQVSCVAGGQEEADGLFAVGLWTGARYLPYDVLWPGFVMNTIFYAAILWLLFAAALALRRWRRTKRGLCPACAYPVGASDLCTECGIPIPSPLRGRVRVGVEGTSPSTAMNDIESSTLPRPLPAREGSQRPASS